MLRMVTKKELRILGNKRFSPFPAWIEMNPEHAHGAHDIIRAVVIQLCDRASDEDGELYTSYGNFKLDCYGKSWRMWYANGREEPDGKLEWEKFSWEKVTE